MHRRYIYRSLDHDSDKPGKSFNATVKRSTDSEKRATQQANSIVYPQLPASAKPSPGRLRESELSTNFNPDPPYHQHCLAVPLKNGYIADRKMPPTVKAMCVLVM